MSLMTGNIPAKVNKFRRGSLNVNARSLMTTGTSINTKEEGPEDQTLT